MGTRLRSKSRVLSAGHRPVAGEETVESEVLDDDEVIEAEETSTSPMSRRSVAEPEPEEEYYSPRQSIGRVGKTAMSKLEAWCAAADCSRSEEESAVGKSIGCFFIFGA